MSPALVVYDGECDFCRSVVKRLRRRDRRGRLTFRPLQDDRVYADHPRLDRSRCERTLHVITPDGAIHAGGDAVREVMRWIAPAPLAWVLGLPVAREVSELAYRLGAANRSRLRL